MWNEAHKGLIMFRFESVEKQVTNRKIEPLLWNTTAGLSA